MSAPNVQIIIYRDPDGDTELSVYLDGRRLSADEYVEHSIDPGVGYTREDWDDRIAEAEAIPEGAFKDEFVQALHDWSDNEYIED